MPPLFDFAESCAIMEMVYAEFIFGKGRMNMNDQYRELIANEFRNCVANTITRISENQGTYRPFHMALLSREVIFWSRFERSFSTSFGQRVIEEVARLVALAYGAEDAARQKETTVRIDIAYKEAIQNHLDRLRTGQRNGGFDWNSTLAEVWSVQPTGTTTDIRVISDLWWRKTGSITLPVSKP